MTATALDDLFAAPLSGYQRILVHTLALAYPREVTREKLIYALYSDDPSGGPENARLVTTILIGRARAKIAPYGWTIPKSRGGRHNPATYRLEKIAGGKR